MKWRTAYWDDQANRYVYRSKEICNRYARGMALVSVRVRVRVRVSVRVRVRVTATVRDRDKFLRQGVC